MNVVGVNGSPRATGNTAALVEAILRGATEAGADTTMLQLGRMSISGCEGCRRCKPQQRCVIQDDMQRFYEVAPQADRLVLASPIYLDHITAQMMAFIQRLFCYIGPPPGVANRYPRPGVGAVLGITFGVGRENAYDDVLDWMEGRLTGYFGIPTLRKFRVAGTADTPPVDASHPTIRQAVEFGRSLA